MIPSRHHSVVAPLRSLVLVAGLLWGAHPLLAGFPEILHTWVRVGHSGETVSVPTWLVPHEDVSGFSYGLEHDASLLTLIEIVPGVSIAGGGGPELFIVDLAPAGGSGGTVDCVVSSDPAGALPAFLPKQLTKFRYQLAPTGPNGFTPIEFTAALGAPPVPVEVTLAGPPEEAVTPFTVDGGVIYLQSGSGPPPLPGVGAQLWFLNGGDGTITVVSLDGIALGTLSAAGQSGPTGVAVSPDGITWVTFHDSDAVVRFDSTGALVDVIPVGDGPSGIAIDSNGSAWVANTLAATLTKIAADGQILLGATGALGEAVPVAAGPVGVAVDPLDNVIVACAGAWTVEKRNADGALVWSQLLLPGSQPTGVVVDREGFAWIADPFAGRVERRASDGTPSAEYTGLSGAAPRALSLRGATEVWAAGEGNGTLLRFAPGEPATVFPIGGAPSGVSVDGEGLIWVTDRVAGTVTRYDAAGAALQTIAIGPEPGFIGDAFGLIPANVLRPDEDFDGDAYLNRIEVDERTNPYDDGDTPVLLPEFVDPVVGLSCGVIVQQVSLAWTNPDPNPFAEIHVLRDGAVAALLPAAAEGFDEPGALALGSYDYAVVGIEAGTGDESDAEGCAVVVGAGNLQGSTQIQVPGLAVNLFGIAAVPGVVHGAAPAGAGEEVAYYLTDPGNDRIYAVDADFQVLSTIISPLAGFAPTTGVVFDPAGNAGAGSLFVCAGANGDPQQDATLIECTLDGVAIGDPYVLVEPLPGLGGIISIKGGLSGMTMDQVSGIFVAASPEVCELFAFRPSPGLPGLLPPVEVPIYPAASAAHPDPAYGLNGVYFPPFAEFSEAGGEVLVSTLLADGDFAISRVQIAAGVATFTGAPVPLAAPDDENVFGDFVVEGDRVAVVGITTGSVHELGSAFFVRGDPDAGGVVDIGDAVQILQVCFMGEVAGHCVDAYDVDDSGTVGIGDAIAILAYLFTHDPAPRQPFPIAGPDPTPDGLPCL